MPDHGQTCAECGLDRSTITPPDAVAALRSFPRRYRDAVTGLDDAGHEPDDVARRRPTSGGWSALEYTAHVRDVLALYDRRIAAVLDDDEPTLPGIDPDDLAHQAAYNDQPVADVLDVLDTSATSLAATVAEVPDDGWSRAGVREGERIDVLWMVRQAVHEGSHHLRDVRRVLNEVTR